jgi:hypothetical protein
MKGVTRKKEQPQREAIDSPFGSFQPLTSLKPSESP